MTGHAKQKQYITQWDLIYHEMMAVNNYYREYAGVHENTSAAYHHHESSKSFTSKNESDVQLLTKYIEQKGSPFSKSCPNNLQNFVTKELMTDNIRTSLLNSTEIGKDKYMDFRQKRISEKKRSNYHKQFIEAT